MEGDTVLLGPEEDQVSVTEHGLVSIIPGLTVLLSRFYPGSRWLVSEISGAITYLIPWHIPYISPGKTRASQQKYNGFEKYGCDVISNVSAYFRVYHAVSSRVYSTSVDDYVSPPHIV